MGLEKWVEYGWLRRGPTSPRELKDLLGIVERSLGDSKVEAVSTDLRFVAAFNAALTVATIALRASGHRTVTQAGHLVKTIESLELTVKASSKVVQRFKTYNNKRNKSTPRMFWTSVKKMSRSASIESSRCYAKAFMREREWKGKRLSLSSRAL